MVAKSIETFCHPSYSPDITPADGIIFQGVKPELFDLSLSQGSFKMSWEVVA
jgi:hypothetical protein